MPRKASWEDDVLDGAPSGRREEHLRHGLPFKVLFYSTLLVRGPFFSSPTLPIPNMASSILDKHSTGAQRGFKVSVMTSFGKVNLSTR